MCIDIKKELGIAPRHVSHKAKKEAVSHWNLVAKPLHSLGKLEEMIIDLAGIYDTCDITKLSPAVLVYCADNGVVEEGISQSTSEVTTMVANSLATGRSNVNLMSRYSDAKVIPVDIGMKDDVSIEGLVNKKISNGTKNFFIEPAMTKQECLRAIKTGIDMVKETKEQGYNILAIGEMGIGNTTTSSAIASVLLDKPVETMTGRGAGLSDKGLKRKIEVIEKSIKLHNLKQNDAFEVLRCVGGYDIAGMAGTCIGGMIYDIPVILDGFISAVAALVATSLIPECNDYLLASHVSKEPAAASVINSLGKEAIIHADMCLGEGTGAVLLFPILNIALDEYNSAHTFTEINLEQYEELT